MTSRADHAHMALFAPRGASRSRDVAANDVLSTRRVAVVSGGSGWDPYEIWATRVRDPRLAKPPGSR